MSLPRYWELTVGVSDDTAEGLTNFVWELGALGVVEEWSPDAAARLRAFFPEAAAGIEERVSDYIDGLRALGFSVNGAPAVAPLTDPGWAVAWREHFRPVSVGRRLSIIPPWETATPPGRIAIVIDPGRAFGTGHHATTAGCLELLESIVERDVPRSALDLGTGSGVLAIAAVRLGVDHVLAVDEDPDAVASATANAEQNGVGDRVRCLVADAGSLHQVAPLVIANLMRAAHLRLAAAYATYLPAGGMLVAGGVLEAEAGEVASALRRYDLAERARITREGWTTLALSASR